MILRAWSLPLWRGVSRWRLWNKMQFRWNSRDVPENQSPGRAWAPEVRGSLYSFSSQSARKEGYLRQRIINDRALSWCPRPRFPRFYRNREIRVSPALPGGSRWQVARERRRPTPLARQRTVSCPRLTLNSSSEPSSGEGWATAGRQNEKFVRRRSGRTGTTGDRWKSVPHTTYSRGYRFPESLRRRENEKRPRICDLAWWAFIVSRRDSFRWSGQILKNAILLEKKKLLSVTLICNHEESSRKRITWSAGYRIHLRYAENISGQIQRR